MTDRCTGDCCKAFALNMSYGELMRSYDAWLKYEDSCVGDDGRHVPITKEIWILALMVRPLGMYVEHPITKIRLKHSMMLYSCVHHDKFTGDCGIYERRPQMCRDFPEGECDYPGCTKSKDGK